MTRSSVLIRRTGNSCRSHLAERILREAQAISSMYIVPVQSRSVIWLRAANVRLGPSQEIALLSEELVRIAPRIGLLVGRAVALAQAGDPVCGFAALNTIPAERVGEYQPYWAARGHLLRQLKRYNEAKESWERTADLTDEPSLGCYLARCAMNTPAL